MKSKLCAIALLTSLTSGASLAIESIDHAIDKVNYKLITIDYERFTELNDKEVDEITVSYDKKELANLISNVQLKLSENKESPKDYEQIELKLFEVILGYYPSYLSYWTESKIINGIKYLQNDKLINMESVNFTNPPHIRNEFAMKRGISPVGNDGDKIQICRLTNNQYATRIELNNYEVKGMSAILFPLSKQSINCESESSLKEYWLDRTNDFIDQYGDFTPRYEYAEQ